MIDHKTNHVATEQRRSRDDGAHRGIRERFQLLVDCPDEAAQRKLYERLAAEGWRLRVLTI